MAASIIGALKYLPASIARKALVKVNPKFANYFSKVVAYGLDTNRALDYLSDRFESESQKSYKDQLRSRESQGLLRPDEMVSKGQLEREEMPGKALRSALAFGTGGLLGGFGSDEQQPASQTEEDPRAAAIAKFQQRQQRPQSELSRESLMQQFQQGQQQEGQQGKAALLQTMQQITQALRQMRGQGG